MNNVERKQAIELLKSIASGQKSRILTGLLLLAVACGLEVLGPLFGKTYIDSYLVPHRADFKMIAIILAASFISGCVASLLRYILVLRFSKIAMDSVKQLREKVYAHVLRLPMAFFDKSSVGELVSRITGDTEAVQRLYSNVLSSFVDSALIVLGSFIVMAWIDWQLMLVVASLIPFSLVITYVYKRMSTPTLARVGQLRGELNTQLAESISGMVVLQASLAEKRFYSRYEATNHSHYRVGIAEVRINSWLLNAAFDLLNSALLIGIIYWSSVRSIDAFDVGILYAFIYYIGRATGRFTEFVHQFGEIQRALVSAARVNKLLHDPTVTSPASEKKIETGNVSFCDVEFGYDPKHLILHHINLELKAGDFYGLVGHTGSGKSTLSSLLLRFYEPQTGRIVVGGVPISELSEEEFRRKVGLVPQEPFILAATIRENIAMGRDLSQEQIQSAAVRAHAHRFIEKLPDGYDTQLGEGGANLSTGQKQLIAIARALAGEYVILILDEATSRIDSETEREVQAALKELRGQVTIIAIAHRLSTIRDADQIIVLNHGRIKELGSHTDLMKISDGIYQQLYSLQTLED